MGNERILVIDDDMYIRNACTEFLRSEGYDVSSAESGEKGIELLAGGPFHLVITDLKMPGIDGLGVLKRVKEIHPKTDVIVVTAHGTIENAVEAMKLGAYDYMTKDFDITELEMIVKRCLEKQRLSAQVSELKELVNLYEISKAISSLMGLDELLKLILTLACDTLAADGGSIMLYDTRTAELVVKVAQGTRRETVLGKRLSLGERVAGFVAREEQPIAIQGPLQDDPRFSHLEEYDAITSSLTVPLQRKGRLMGVINLYRRENPVVFGQHDIKLLSIFAVEGAIAIENTSLFNTLQQEKEELDATFAGMADGAVVVDGQLQVVRCNRAAEELLGITSAAAAGKSITRIIPHFEPSLPWNEIRFHQDGTIRFELSRTIGKSLFLGVVATAINDIENGYLGQIMVLRNVTAEKREERLKSDFLAIISHKLKTPLTTISGFSSLLAENPASPLDDKTRYALSAIKKQGDLLNLLVDKLLRFTLLISQYTQLGQERTEMGPVIDRCLKGLSFFIRNQGAEVTVDPGIAVLPALWIDGMKAGEVLENLVENAIKFNDKPKKTVRISGRVQDEKFAVIEVADNGAGIPPEEQRNIFQKFYQIDEHFTGQIEGAGLGLALVKQIVELHGGKVWVESTLGEGSIFRFTLPLFTEN